MQVKKDVKITHICIYHTLGSTLHIFFFLKLVRTADPTARSSGVGAEIRVWHAVPVQVSQRLTEQHVALSRSGDAGVFTGPGSTETWVSGSPEHGNEVMAQKLQRSPSALLVLSHLCSVLPSGMQLLPVIRPLIDGSTSLWLHLGFTTTSHHHYIIRNRPFEVAVWFTLREQFKRLMKRVWGVFDYVFLKQPKSSESCT